MLYILLIELWEDYSGLALFCMQQALPVCPQMMISCSIQSPKSPCLVKRCLNMWSLAFLYLLIRGPEWVIIYQESTGSIAVPMLCFESSKLCQTSLKRFPLLWHYSCISHFLLLPVCFSHQKLLEFTFSLLRLCCCYYSSFPLEVISLFAFSFIQLYSATINGGIINLDYYRLLHSIVAKVADDPPILLII